MHVPIPLAPSASVAKAVPCWRSPGGCHRGSRIPRQTLDIARAGLMPTPPCPMATTMACVRGESTFQDPSGPPCQTDSGAQSGSGHRLGTPAPGTRRASCKSPRPPCPELGRSRRRNNTRQPRHSVRSLADRREPGIWWTRRLGAGSVRRHAPRQSTADASIGVGRGPSCAASKVWSPELVADYAGLRAAQLRRPSHKTTFVLAAETSAWPARKRAPQ